MIYFDLVFLFHKFNSRMSQIIQLHSIPPEIWNCILFFTGKQDLELIRFLMFHQLTFNLSLDIPKIKKLYQRNIKPICRILTPINKIENIVLLDYSTLYLSSMISENIKAGQE